jgi:hypothetical protein
MLTIKENYHNFESDFKDFLIRGFCVSELYLDGEIGIIFQKGIGVTLIQKIIDLYKEIIMDKRQGYIIDNIGNLTIYIHFFEMDQDDKLVITYIDKTENTMNYTQLYNLSKKIFNQINIGLPNLKIDKIFNEIVKIPRAKGLIGLFIVGKAGYLYFSKVNKSRTKIAQNSFQIAGFISAILIYSQDCIAGEESGLELEDMDFGDHHFYVTTKKDVIFAYLVEKTTKSENIKRYMQLVVEEFLEKYYTSNVKSFNGDLSPFNEFEKTIDQYFII